MTSARSSRPISIFTPSFADEDNSNAQNLTVKELVSRLRWEQFHVTMICQDQADPRIAKRPNTEFVGWTKHGNAPRLLRRCLFAKPDIYFFPRSGPLDRTFFDLRKYLGVSTALVSYIVSSISENTNGLTERSILEADLVCANSERVAEAIHETFGVESVVIHDGVDQRYYFPRSKKPVPGPLVVLYAGSFRPLKRVELVIEQAVRWPSVEFRLAGKGETEDRCRDLCAHYGCGNVRWLGHLSSMQLGDEMRNASVFLFPSVSEGHPQVLIQAAACGLPSVAMKTYQPEAVVDGLTGFLVESDQELAHRLDLLLTDHQTRRNMADASIVLARKFDWDRIAADWADLFCRLVQERGKSRSPKKEAFGQLHAR